MTANSLYAVATLLTWVGWAFVFRVGYLGLKLAIGAATGETVPVQRGIMVAALIAAASMGVASTLAKVAPTSGVSWSIPLVWVVMPFWGWLAGLAAGMVGLRLVQSGLAIDSVARRSRLMSTIGWGLAALAGVCLYRADSANQINVIRGSIGITPTVALVIALLGVSGIVAMVLAERSTALRGFTRGLAAQAALISGAIIFGLPFAFLVITSFKEDRDMSSPNGIVWVPKVQETRPYLDPKDPLFEGSYRGQTVQGSVLETLPDGRVRVDIFKPLAIRGTTFEVARAALKEVPKEVPVVTATVDGQRITGLVVRESDEGKKTVLIELPAALKGQEREFEPAQVEPVRNVGLRWQNYSEAISFLPPETRSGLVYLKNTLILVVFSVIGTLLSSSICAYAFSRLKFPGRDTLFMVLLSTMMLPAAVTLLPQFLIFRQLGWIDTLYPLWVPAFFGSAFNIFLLRQFFLNIPMELEDASKIDGCTYLKTFWSVMLPQIKPALAVIAIWTFMGAWNNFMGPLIYVNSPENMPLSYALQLFQGDRSGEPGLLMAFATMAMLPVLALFFFAQRYFIEGVTLSGLGGR